MPRPTRPRSWCSCESPKRSAFSTIISEALGTFTPTSMTVVETSTSVSPSAKALMTASFSPGFILPCISATLTSGSAAASSSTQTVAALSGGFSSNPSSAMSSMPTSPPSTCAASSIEGQTTYTCPPSRTVFSIKPFTRAR